MGVGVGSNTVIDSTIIVGDSTTICSLNNQKKNIKIKIAKKITKKYLRLFKIKILKLINIFINLLVKYIVIKTKNHRSR